MLSYASRQRKRSPTFRKAQFPPISVHTLPPSCQQAPPISVHQLPPSCHHVPPISLRQLPTQQN